MKTIYKNTLLISIMIALTLGFVVYISRDKKYKEGECLTVISAGVRKEINQGAFSYVQVSSVNVMGYRIKNFKLNLSNQDQTVTDINYSKEKYISIRSLEDLYTPIQCPVKGQPFNLKYL